MSLDEQRNIIERALAEQMLYHALTILRQWAKEVGADLYSDRIQSLEQNYRYAFNYFLSNDDSDRDGILVRLTYDVYRLADELYGDVRIKRGLSPQMVGFNPDNPESVMHYFSACVHFQEEDLDWLRDAIYDPQRSGQALLAMAAMAQNLREVFQERALLTLIEAADADSELISNQATTFSILLLAQWDIRIDYFLDLQDAFFNHILDAGKGLTCLNAIVRSSQGNLKTLFKQEVQEMDEVPEELRQLLEEQHIKMEDEQIKDKLGKMTEMLPQSEADYLQAIVDILPETWVYDMIVGEEDEPNREMALLYLSTGKMDLMWDHLDEAEDWLVNRLRSGKATPADYINYAHCCFIRGDRAMAYENYREARTQMQSARAFMGLFRPDRKMLVEKGVPLDYIYLMEDNLLRLN